MHPWKTEIWIGNIKMLCGALPDSVFSTRDAVRGLQLPKWMELVGLGYSAWFTYRYLLFKVSCALAKGSKASHPH